jgi:hypothetical protein
MSCNVLVLFFLGPWGLISRSIQSRSFRPWINPSPAHLVDVRTLRTCSRFDYIHHADQGLCGNQQNLGRFPMLSHLGIPWKLIEVPSLSQTHCDCLFFVYIYIIIYIYHYRVIINYIFKYIYIYTHTYTHVTMKHQHCALPSNQLIRSY